MLSLAAVADILLMLLLMLLQFETMSAYGVPAVAGAENLGLFTTAYDTSSSAHTLRGSRGSILRSLLAQPSSGSIRSLDLGSPTSQEGDRDAAADALTASSVTDDSGIDAFKTRYMFSFDDSCYVLAKQLHDDLMAAGFSVFPPPPPPIPGSLESAQANANAHEEALQWAASEKNGKVILLVTPESVGRPSGVCLNDISAAMAAGLGFVPLMVRQCEIPLSICRIQWLDMSDCLIYDQAGTASSAAARLVDSVSINSVRYAIRVEQLVTAMKGKLDHEGQQARLFSILSPLSFQQQISKLTNRFVGREWLFTDLEQWIATPATSQVYWVTGPIGSGKTALAARMVQLIPEIAAFHFALQEDEQTQNARRCVLSLAYQLTTQLPEYASFLQSREPLEEVVPVSNFNTLVTRLLVEPLNDIARHQSAKPLVLLIDGLEHLAAGQSGQEMSIPTRPSFGRSSGVNFAAGIGASSNECLVSALPSLVSRLPNWVRVVVLSRKDPAISAKLQGYTPSIVLDAYRAENDQDIQLYVEKSLGASGDSTDESSGMVVRNRSPSLGSAPASSSHSLSPEQVSLIVKRSEGLFLYAVNIVQSIEERRLAVDQLQSLPIGMGGYFQQFFESHFDELLYKVRWRCVCTRICRLCSWRGCVAVQSTVGHHSPSSGNPVRFVRAVLAWYDRLDVGLEFVPAAGDRVVVRIAAVCRRGREHSPVPLVRVGLGPRCGVGRDVLRGCRERPREDRFVGCAGVRKSGAHEPERVYQPRVSS